MSNVIKENRIGQKWPKKYLFSLCKICNSFFSPLELSTYDFDRFCEIQLQITALNN